MTPCLLKSTLLQQTSQDWGSREGVGEFELPCASALLFSKIFYRSDKDEVAWLSKPVKGIYSEALYFKSTNDEIPARLLSN